MQKPLIIIKNLVGKIEIMGNDFKPHEVKEQIQSLLVNAVKSVEISEEKTVNYKQKGHTLLTADSIAELQAKVAIEKEQNEGAETVTVYGAVVSAYTVD